MTSIRASAQVCPCLGQTVAILFVTSEAVHLLVLNFTEATRGTRRQSTAVSDTAAWHSPYLWVNQREWQKNCFSNFPFQFTSPQRRKGEACVIAILHAWTMTFIVWTRSHFSSLQQLIMHTPHFCWPFSMHAAQFVRLLWFQASPFIWFYNIHGVFWSDFPFFCELAQLLFVVI